MHANAQEAASAKPGLAQSFLTFRAEASKYQTFDLNENVLVEMDAKGRVVSMTIEHAKEQADVSEFTYQLASA